MMELLVYEGWDEQFGDQSGTGINSLPFLFFGKEVFIVATEDGIEPLVYCVIYVHYALKSFLLDWCVILWVCSTIPLYSEYSGQCGQVQETDCIKFCIKFFCMYGDHFFVMLTCTRIKTTADHVSSCVLGHSKGWANFSSVCCDSCPLPPWLIWLNTQG